MDKSVLVGPLTRLALRAIHPLPQGARGGSTLLTNSMRPSPLVGEGARRVIELAGEFDWDEGYGIFPHAPLRRVEYPSPARSPLSRKGRGGPGTGLI